MDSLIRMFGSQRALASALGVTESAVSQWFKKGCVPLPRAVEIVRITSGKIKLKDISGNCGK